MNIFDYTDFRKFLLEYFQEQKQRNKNFSQRYFAQKLGVKSAGFLSEVFNGKRNLSQRNIIQFSVGLELNKDEDYYFENLVHLNQAKTVVEQKHFFERLMQSKKVNMELINKDQYEFYSTWYHTAIRELLFYYKFSGEYRDLAKQLTPSITEQQAKNSIELMARLELIVQNDKGYWVPKHTTITTGRVANEIQVSGFQMETAKMGVDAIDKLPERLRDISTLTFSLSKNGFEKVKTLLAKTRKDILKVAQEDEGENRVYHTNLHLFPLTRDNDLINQKGSK